MYTFLIVVYVLVSASLIGLVLIQHGKGADAGAAFGSGASGTVFGSRGSANFLSRSTAWLAAVFFALSLVLAYFMHGRATQGSVVDTMPAKPATAVQVPVAPPVPTAKTDAAPAAAAAPQQAAPVTDAKPAAPAAVDASKGAAQPAAPATPKVPQ